VALFINTITFDGRCIPARYVALRLNTPGILASRALRSRRLSLLIMLSYLRTGPLSYLKKIFIEIQNIYDKNNILNRVLWVLGYNFTSSRLKQSMRQIMNDENNREFTRKKVWQDTEATIKVNDPFSGGSRKTMSITGIVDNLSTGGMFLKTEESVPISSKAEIIINFDPASTSSDLSVKANGNIVHTAENGLGIKFTSINMTELQQCIIKKMNQRP
jgi:hypothetical protein